MSTALFHSRSRKGSSEVAARERLLAGAAVCLLSLFAFPAHAHDPFETTSVVSIHRDGIGLRLVAARATAKEIFGAQGNLIVDEAWPEMATMKRPYELSSGDRPLDLRRVTVSAGMEGEVAGDLVFDFEFAAPRSSDVRVRAVYLEELEQGYTGVVQVIDAERAEQLDVKVLHSADPLLEVRVPGVVALGDDASSLEPAEAPRPLARFLRLGFEHLAFGYDHLLFLATVLIACARLGQVLGGLTAFTLAHAVTLSLAALRFIPTVSYFVEPVIALSIAVAALWGARLEAKGLLLPMTFVFGLIHGLGFAAGLESLMDPGNVRIVGLVGFNLGLELGQIAAACALLPVIQWCRRTMQGERALDWTGRALGAAGGALFLWRVAGLG